MICRSGADVPVKRVTVGGVGFDPLTENRVVDHVRAALERGQGGRIITPNVDVLRQIRSSPDARAALADSTLVVADGMPVIWASRLAGTPLPARVSGADLVWSLARGLGSDGRTLFVLGGEPVARHDRLGASLVPQQKQASIGSRYAIPPVPARNDCALIAAAALVGRSPGLTVVGAISPRYGFDLDPAEVARIRAEVVAAAPDLVLVGVGFLRQERLIADIRRELPGSWFMGCGQAINFVAGERQRAPFWMQRAGVEWLHRMMSEPSRLAERYLRYDLPFVASLLTRTAISRCRRAPTP
jgi:N-acetylglucosaminyldiphosphoundecaprenol N-acetyl-beta-D-mannosaminyltransferase